MAFNPDGSLAFCLSDENADMKIYDTEVFVKSNNPLPVPRITFTMINKVKDLGQAIVVNHIQEFCRENTIYDIKMNNGLYKQFNYMIDFGVIVVFCF